MPDSVPSSGRPATDASQTVQAKNRPLSVRQQQILTIISESTRNRGYAPSLREIAEGVGLTSTSSVVHQINNLQEAGFITRDPKRPRTYQVVADLGRPKPARAPRSPACSILVSGDSAGESGTAFVLQVLVGDAVGRALLNGALLTVKRARPGPGDPPGSDQADIFCRVVAVTHPL